MKASLESMESNTLQRPEEVNAPKGLYNNSTISGTQVHGYGNMGAGSHASTFNVQNTTIIVNKSGDSIPEGGARNLDPRRTDVHSHADQPGKNISPDEDLHWRFLTPKKARPIDVLVFYVQIHANVVCGLVCMNAGFCHRFFCPLCAALHRHRHPSRKQLPTSIAAAAAGFFICLSHLLLSPAAIAAAAASDMHCILLPTIYMFSPDVNQKWFNKDEEKGVEAGRLCGKKKGTCKQKACRHILQERSLGCLWSWGIEIDLTELEFHEI